MLSLVILLVSFLLYTANSNSCRSSQDDHYLVSAILENALAGDCVTLRRLAGAFFTNQERPPHSVRVKYNLCIPLNKNCSANDGCNCWSSKNCNLNSSICPADSCLVEREFLWGRIPLIVEDNIYRTLNVCPFMIGGNTEKRVSINFTLAGSEEDILNCITTKQFPCSWCSTSSLYQFDYVPSTNGIDNIATFAQKYSTIDQALFTLTEKLQGYAIKAHALPWLVYSNDQAIGYAARYPLLKNSPIVLIRHIGFFTSYFLFQLILFMLIYKYRKRFYRRIYAYINSDQINSAFFYSFIVTSILTGCGMLVGTNDGGYCLTIFQVLLLGIALLFSIPHGLIVCLRLKKRPDFFNVFPLFCSCIHRGKLNIIAQVFVFWLLFSMPHTVMYLLLIIFFDLFYNPFSYLVVLMYLGLSIIALWIGNAIYFHLTSTSLANYKNGRWRNKAKRRRFIFGVSIALAINILYFTTWGFVGSFFYDKRGHATSYMTFVPGFAITLIGWYLSGDLVKVFDMFTQSKYETNQSKDLLVPENEIDKERRSSAAEIELSGLQEHDENTPLLERSGGESRSRYSIKRLKRLVRVVTREPAIDLLQESDNEYEHI